MWVLVLQRALCEPPLRDGPYEAKDLEPVPHVPLLSAIRSKAVTTNKRDY